MQIHISLNIHRIKYKSVIIQNKFFNLIIFLFFFLFYRPVDFRALYEFVDLYQDGEPYGTGPCSRVFYSRNRDNYPEKKFRAPRDIFLYGRGGAKNLS